jgi:HK97 family phage major capsid protein
MEYIKQQVAERDSLATQIVSLAEKAAHEDRSLTESENGSIAGMKARVDVLDAELRQWKDIQSAVVNFTPIADAVADKAAKAKDEDVAGEWRSVGELWTQSAEWADYAQRPRGNSGMLQVPIDSMETRANILTTTYAGVIPKDRIAPSMAPTAQTPLSSLVNTINVAGNSVEWVFYPAAAPLGVITAEGAPKTEAAVTLTVVTVTLDTIASWAKYSRQFAADGPGLVDFITGALSRGINDKKEALIAAELTGNANIPVTANTSGTLIGGIRKAIGTVQAAGFVPQAAVLNPADYAALDVGVMAVTFNGPQSNSSYWGIQVVAVGAVASGTAFVGDFNTGMAWLQRQDVTVYTTDSDISGAGATAASDFRSNILTTLAEARGKAIVQRPEALTKVSGTVPASMELEAEAAKGRSKS